jgi:hypothetical protein
MAVVSPMLVVDVVDSHFCHIHLPFCFFVWAFCDCLAVAWVAYHRHHVSGHRVGYEPAGVQCFLLQASLRMDPGVLAVFLLRWL